MLLGNARVSTQDQDTAAQVAALEAIGCELIFQETVSSGRWNGPELHHLFGYLSTGDMVDVLETRSPLSIPQRCVDLDGSNRAVWS